jgi:glutamate formiminotransferase/formiminotetrahydrofolate cyclodeaminase
MSGQLIECIPNFSEARRPDVVEAIKKAIVQIPNVNILDVHSDIDHNRTVITYIGSPQEVEEAAFQAIKTSAELINLDQHKGSHPRVGATDVVPFVPISGITMEECINIARHLAERVGNELNIPVYLYEEAALNPKRKNLEKIRKGGYEVLREEIITNNERKPDFGPNSLNPAGATIIGARHPLVAFNVYLASKDIDKAKAIARIIRTSSGGLPSVKALGMMVQGRAQVSMNLTNFRQTSIQKVFNAIKLEASKLKVKIHHSELVGLIPQEALLDAAISYLKLDEFDNNQILEQRLALGKKNEQYSKNLNFIEELASNKPSPGGGSAAAYTGAMAAALISMVARLTIGKKKYEAVTAQMQEILLQAERIRIELVELVQQDAKAFDDVMAAFKLPREEQDQESLRMQAIEIATLNAAQVPMQVAQLALKTLALAERAVSLGNINAISDASSAAALAIASIIAAGYNIRINLANLNDEIAIASLHKQLEQVELRASRIDHKLQKLLKEKGLI